MPIKRTKDEILRVWTAKVTNPQVARERVSDLVDYQKERLRLVTNIMVPVNEIISAVLDKHGIVGGKRIDYYNFGRKVWRVIYERTEEMADKMIKLEREYSISIFGLVAEVVDEIQAKVGDYAKQIKAELEALKEAERKALLEASSEVVSESGEVVGDIGSTDRVGDSVKDNGTAREG